MCSVHHVFDPSLLHYVSSSFHSRIERLSVFDASQEIRLFLFHSWRRPLILREHLSSGHRYRRGAG